MDVVIYTRVSTDDQKENGFSLQDQERRLRNECERKGKNIVKHYQDDSSAKDFNRPAFKQFLDDVRNKTIKVREIICIRADRFSRKVEATLVMRQTLRKAGIEVVFLENNVDLGIPENLIVDLINLALPQVENERRGMNTKHGLRQAMREGKWVARAPKGYKNDKINKAIVIGDDAHFIQKAFNEVAQQIKSIDQTRKDLNEEGFKCCKQQFYNLLKNPFYTGYIKILAWRDEEEELVKGLHDPLISTELFNRVQEIFNKGNRKDIRPSKYNPKFPLRGHLICNKCGKKLTGSSSKGRNGYHDYYHCQNGCSERLKAKVVNPSFNEYLKSYNISDEIVKLYKEVIEDVFKQKEGTKAEKVSKVKQRIVGLRENLYSLDERLLSNEIMIDDYNRISKNLKSNIDALNAEVEELENSETNLEKHFRFGLSMMKNLNYFYEIGDVPVKQKIVGSIFPEKLIFDGNNYRTARINSFISLIASQSKNLDRLKTKQVANVSDLSNMAPPLGLEPRTL